MEITPIILCGGSGTRLWPLSRHNYPKQFVKVVNDQTLFETTLLRIQQCEYLTNPIIICNERHQYLCLEQLQALDIQPLDIIIEPVGRNTTPAITMACLRLQQLRGSSANILVLPIDHVFGDPQAYFQVIQHAAKYAEQSLVTFGIKPSYAHTGYGYIRRDNEVDTGLYAVKEFIEKPLQAAAEKLIAAGDVYWNSGTFLFNISCFLNEVVLYHPDIFEFCQAALEQAKRKQQFLNLDCDSFKSCEDISVDYAILEKSKKVMVAELDLSFIDIGSWESVYEYGQKDQDRNVKRGSVYCEDTKNCLLYTQDSLLVTTGIEDCIVVATKDGIFISKQGESQQVKQMLPKLQTRYPEQFNNQTHVRRPWGSYTVLTVEPGYKVKRLTVNPGEKLSLQLHNYRSEHWVVVSGIATIVYGMETRLLQASESVFIPEKTKHRIANNGNEPLVIIETQMGGRVDEDDIVRFEDIYERDLQKV
jgi:mannose-1-phosphate guanylyltransferase/mannose-6-phosphate isomerase